VGRESGKLEVREDFVCAKTGVAVVSLEYPICVNTVNVSCYDIVLLLYCLDGLSP